MKAYVGLFFFLFFMCHEQIVDGYRILGLIPLNGRSHFIVGTGLLQGLAERGHQVDVVSHFPLKKPIPNYRDISLKGSLPAAMNNLSADEIAAFSTTFSFTFLVEKTGNSICELMNLPQIQELIKNPPQDPPYDIVITELFMSPCYLAFGRHLNATMIGFVASALHDWLNEPLGNPHNPAYIPGLFSSFTQNMNFWERLVNTLQSHFTIGHLSYLLEKQNVYVEKFFGSHMPSISELYKDLALVLVNSHHSLNGLRPMTNSLIEVGGIHVRDTEDPFPPELKKWLDESKDGVVVFTLGSMARVETFPKRIVEAFYAAFKRIAPVKVLMKVAKPEDLIPGLPKNVKIDTWLPQLAVLKHPNVRAFITHGGLMGTTEAVYCGVPMIGIPLFGDQTINIQNYVNKKIAVSLGGIYDLTEDKIFDGLNTVLKDPQYRENVKSLSQRFMDRPMKPVDEAVYWVEYVGRYGNILQSPAVYLTWWQRNLVDVYGFILLCLAVVLYVLYFILKTLKNCLCGSQKCTTKSTKSNKKKE